MNEAQLFTIPFSILVFGWVGFATGRAWGNPDDEIWHFGAIVVFFLGSAAMFIAAMVNLGWLLVENF